MSNTESIDFNHASPFGEGTGIDESPVGYRNKLTQALLDETRATGDLSLLVNPKPEVKYMAEYKVRDAKRRVRFWADKLDLD